MLESLFNKIVGWRRKRLCEICEIFKNTYIEQHLWTTASASQVLYPAASNTTEDLAKQQQERKKYSLETDEFFFSWKFQI